MDGITGGFLADVLSLSIGEARKGIGDVNASDVRRRSLLRSEHIVLCYRIRDLLYPKNISRPACCSRGENVESLR